MSMNHGKSPFLSLSELSEADDRQRAGKAPRIESSGLLDLRQMAKVYDKQDQRRGRDQDAIPELVTVGIGTPLGLVLPLPAPPDVDQQRQEAQRNRLLYVMSAVAGVLGLAAIALAFVLLRGGFAQSPQAGVPGPQQPVPQAGQPAQPAQPAAIAQSPAAAEDADRDERGTAASDTAEPKQSTSIKAARNDDGDDARNDDGDDARNDDGDDRATSRKSRRSERRSKDRDDNSDARQAAAPKPAPAAPPEDKCMDEIACELAPNPPACCSRYKSRDSGSGGLLSVGESRRAPDDDLPRNLERSDISAGMDTVQGSVATCRASHPVKGTVKVSLKVNGEGKVDSVRVVSSPTDGLGNCVASKVRRARFARTQRGATFSYPFIFN